MAPQRTIEKWKQTNIAPKGNPPEHSDPWMHVNEEDRTAGKDECANYILNDVIEQDRWPMDVQAIADEAGWSRQHTRSTLDDYFEPVDQEEEADQMRPERHARELQINIPEDVENITDYLAGVSKGYNLCKQEA